MDDKRWKIGELAAVTGVTVRTLHHYDDLGVLVPSERSAAGHRLYAGPDVQRLYAVLALRQIGLPLEEIRVALDGGFDLRNAIARQLDRIEAQLHYTHELRARLGRLLRALETVERPSSEELIDTMEVMNRMDKYYTPEQQADLEERRKQLGDEGMERAQNEWAEVIEGMEAERARGTDVTDPRVQQLVGRWQNLIEQFTRGDEGIRKSLQIMYEQEGPEAASRGMVDQELMAYAHRAIEAGNKRS